MRFMSCLKRMSESPFCACSWNSFSFQYSVFNVLYFGVLCSEPCHAQPLLFILLLQPPPPPPARSISFSFSSPLLFSIFWISYIFWKHFVALYTFFFYSHRDFWREQPCWTYSSVTNILAMGKSLTVYSRKYFIFHFFHLTELWIIFDLDQYYKQKDVFGCNFKCSATWGTLISPKPFLFVQTFLFK